MTRRLLVCVNKDFGHKDLLMDVFEQHGDRFSLKQVEQRLFWIILTTHIQQKYMCDTDTHSCPDRIVSIHQPHVRPIPRGKIKAQIEFGPKLGVSLDQGFTRINNFSWNAYHESGDLIPQVEAYKELHGHYPELVQIDTIYATRENRRYLKERGIRITAAPLGRKPVKAKQSYYQRRKARKEAAERNHIEGKFGQGKNGYNLNEIRARLKATSESWVACIFFVMNLINYEKIGFLGSILKWLDRLMEDLSCLVNWDQLIPEQNSQAIKLSN